MKFTLNLYIMLFTLLIPGLISISGCRDKKILESQPEPVNQEISVAYLLSEKGLHQNFINSLSSQLSMESNLKIYTENIEFNTNYSGEAIMILDYKDKTAQIAEKLNMKTDDFSVISILCKGFLHFIIDETNCSMKSTEVNSTEEEESCKIGIAPDERSRIIGEYIKAHLEINEENWIYYENLENIAADITDSKINGLIMFSIVPEPFIISLTNEREFFFFDLQSIETDDFMSENMDYLLEMMPQSVYDIKGNNGMSISMPLFLMIHNKTEDSIIMQILDSLWKIQNNEDIPVFENMQFVELSDNQINGFVINNTAVKFYSEKSEEQAEEENIENGIENTAQNSS